MLSRARSNNKLFDTHGRFPMMVKEWNSYDKRLDTIAVLETKKKQLSVEKENLLENQKTKRARTSSSSSSSRPSLSNEDQERLDVIEKQYNDYVNEIDVLNLTNEETEVYDCFIGSNQASVGEGSLVAGFSFQEELLPSKNQDTTENEEGSYILSTKKVEYIYSLHSWVGDTNYLRLAYKSSTMMTEIPEIMVIEENKEDEEILFLTNQGLVLFDILALCKQGTPIGKDLKANAAIWRQRRSEDDHQKKESPPGSPNSSSTPSPKSSTAANLKSSEPIPTIKETINDKNNTTLQLLSDVVTNYQPASLQTQAKEAERSRLFLLRVTMSTENIRAILGYGADVHKKDANFIAELLDRFTSNSGGSDNKEFQKLPFMQEGKCIQQFLLGKFPENIQQIVTLDYFR